MQSDSVIWNNFLEGDQKSLSLIYTEYVNELYNFGKLFTNNNDLIEDTIQDLFFDLIRRKKSLGQTDNIKAYLFGAFKNKIFRSLKNDKKLILNNDLICENDEGTSSAEEDFITNESKSNEKKVVQNTISKLTDKQREILYYRFICDFEYDEICELMNLKYDSARKNVYRALQACKNFIIINSKSSSIQ